MKFIAACASILLMVTGVAPAPVDTSSLLISGTGTYYYQNGNTGSCGQQHSDIDTVSALSIVRMGNQSPSSLCGSMIWAQDADTGYYLEMEVVDTCAGCAENDVDFSVAAYDWLTGGDWAVGRFPLDWGFL